MSVSRLVALLVVAGVATAPAQLAVTAPSQKLLLLPLTVRAAADSLTSIQVMDAARDRLTALAHYKVLVVPKSKLCEALLASGYSCDVLMQDGEAGQLARFLQVNAYNTGSLQRRGAKVDATVRVHENGGSGMAALIQVSASGTPQAVGDTLAQRLNSIIRAAESARDCNDKRQRGALPAALEAARRAILIEPNLPAAHLCIAVVYEAQRMPLDSMLGEYRRALKGDSLNGTAWDAIARIYQQKGDSLAAIDAFIHELGGEPHNGRLRVAIAIQLGQLKKYAEACDLLNAGLELNPQDPAMHELRQRLGIEGEQWTCVLEELHASVAMDSARAADSTFLNTGIGAAQKANDPGEQVFFTTLATTHFPKVAKYWNARGTAYAGAGKPDSALWALKQSLALNPQDVPTGLLVARSMIDQATYDTARARALDAAHDSAGVKAMRNALAETLDSARGYLSRAATSADSTIQLNVAAVTREAGEKLVRAGAGERAVPWLEQSLQLLGFAPATPGDTTGPRAGLRVNGSFWYGLAAFGGLRDEFTAMAKTKNCVEAKAFNDHLNRVRAALTLGRSVHAPTVDRYLGFLANFDKPMQSVRQSFKCKNF